VTYRDELEGLSWSAFISRPIRHIIDAIPILQVQDHHNPILDVWDRQFLNDRSERCKPADATIFMACFRSEEAAAPTELPAVYYIEPRTEDGRAPDPAFWVVWLNKADRQSAIAASQSPQQWNTVVR